MSLDVVRETFEKLGRDDPLYGVLTDHKRRHNKWDPAEFFETGVKEIAGVMAYLEAQQLTIARGAVLDFGCGVGRLSQALALHFERVTGVDIADTMIENARKFNQHGDRVRYVVNTVDDLSRLESASFDFVYTNITLQHMPPEAATKYIQEFFRLLKPGGHTVFQVPSGPEYTPGSLSGAWYTFRRRHWRRFWKAIRGRATYEMHYIPRPRVEQIITAAGGRLLDTVAVSGSENYRYCAVNART